MTSSVCVPNSRIELAAFPPAQLLALPSFPQSPLVLLGQVGGGGQPWCFSAPSWRMGSCPLSMPSGWIQQPWPLQTAGSWYFAPASPASRQPWIKFRHNNNSREGNSILLLSFFVLDMPFQGFISSVNHTEIIRLNITIKFASTVSFWISYM